jgi:hypothetical protein
MKVGLRPEQQVDRDTMTGKKKKKKDCKHLISAGIQRAST